MKKTPVEKSIQPFISPPIKRMAIAAAALSLAFGPGQALASRPLGIDVSSYQGSINWTSVKGAGITFAWAKATEGNYYQDVDYAGNMSNGKTAGVYMGAYHFARPDLNKASTEAGYFWSFAKGYIKGDGKSYQPMLDFETFNGVVGAANYADWVNQWCALIQSDANGASVALEPIVYCSSCFSCDLNNSVAQWLADVANYNGESSQTGTPWNICTSCEVWGANVWNVWQYTSSGTYPGIPDANVDHDVFNGSSSQMISTMVPTGTKTAKIVPNPSAGNDTDGRIELFAVDASGSMDHNWQTSDNGGWTSWVAFGSSDVQKTVTGVNANGSLENFVINGTDNHVYNSYWTGSGWSAYAVMGVDSFKDICVAKNAVDGHLEMFGISTGGVLYHNYQTSPNGYTSWSGWISIGGSGGTRVESCNNQNGNITAFMLGSGGVLYQSFSGGSENYGTPSSLGGVSSDLTAVSWAADGHIEIFAVGASGEIYHIWQIGSNGSGGWSTWAALGGVNYTRIKGAINSVNNPEIFVLSSSGTTEHFWWNSSDGWNGPYSMGGISENITVRPFGNGNLCVFAVGTTGNMYYNEYIGGNTGWAGWATMGGNLQK